MNLNLENSNFKSIKAPYPIGYVDNFISQENCKKLYDEIINFSSFDDLVMSGRQRVNKGSKRFDDYLKTSPALLSLYSQLNEKNFYLCMKKILDNLPSSKIWFPSLNDFDYSKENFGEQSFSFFKYLRKTKLISNFFKSTINLDMDFSKSKYGYFRSAHRDRDTRIISFLLYLNTIDDNEGGEFEIYKLKKETTDTKTLKRFPEKESTIKLYKYPPRSGQLFIFTSTPNSYHGVSKFLSKDKLRVFVYGSYSLDRRVEWKAYDTKN